MIKHLINQIKKISVYIFFGLGALVMGILVLPVERVFIHPNYRFRQVGRKTITSAYRLVLWYCKLLGIIHIRKDKLNLAGLEGKIVAPNHPSLLDVVVLFSILPGANCIVRGNLTNSIVGLIIKALYIANNENINKLKIDCKESLDRKETLIIFPEGTRTIKDTPITLRRGTAYISLYANAPIVPFFIKGNDKKGLRKKDPFWMMNDDGYYEYVISRSTVEFKPQDYQYFDNQRKASYALTQDLQNYYRENV